MTRFSRRVRTTQKSRRFSSCFRDNQQHKSQGIYCKPYRPYSRMSYSPYNMFFEAAFSWKFWVGFFYCSTRKTMKKFSLPGWDKLVWKFLSFAVKIFLKNKISLSPNRFSPCGFSLGMLPKIYCLKISWCAFISFSVIRSWVTAVFISVWKFMLFPTLCISGLGIKLRYFWHLNRRLKLRKTYMYYILLTVFVLIKLFCFMK